MTSAPGRGSLVSITFPQAEDSSLDEAVAKDVGAQHGDMESR
jgi:hypothetical protein